MYEMINLLVDTHCKIKGETYEDTQKNILSIEFYCYGITEKIKNF